MILASQIHSQGEPGKPWLVWLHGLLGSGADWQGVLPYFSDFPCLTIDLPGHGESVDIRVSGFAELSSMMSETLAQRDIWEAILIGYSLGGRVAMYHACYSEGFHLKGLAIEGGNLGLSDETDKRQRLANDRRWAEAFRHQPIQQALADWYRQPVFAELSQKSRDKLIAKRAHNCGEAIASMLEATSLAVQPDLSQKLPVALSTRQIPFCYLCGEFDQKFQQLAKQYHLPVRTILSAGHNAHLANPAGLAEQLFNFIKEC